MGQTGSTSGGPNGVKYGAQDGFRIHSRVDDLVERDVLETPPPRSRSLSAIFDVRRDKEGDGAPRVSQSESRPAALTPPAGEPGRSKPRLVVDTDLPRNDFLEDSDAVRPSTGKSSATSASSNSHAYYNADEWNEEGQDEEYDIQDWEDHKEQGDSYWDGQGYEQGAADAAEAAQETSDLLFQMIPYCHLGDENTDELVMSTLRAGGFHVDTSDSYGNTLLILACQYANEAIASVVMDLNADVNAQNAHGASALHFACFTESMSVDIAKMLLNRGADVGLAEHEYGCTALHYAVACHSVELLRLLLRFGASRHASKRDADGKTALDYAREQSFAEGVAVLGGGESGRADEGGGGSKKWATASPGSFIAPQKRMTPTSRLIHDAELALLGEEESEDDESSHALSATPPAGASSGRPPRPPPVRAAGLDPRLAALEEENEKLKEQVKALTASDRQEELISAKGRLLLRLFRAHAVGEGRAAILRATRARVQTEALSAAKLRYLMQAHIEKERSDGAKVKSQNAGFVAQIAKMATEIDALKEERSKLEQKLTKLDLSTKAKLTLRGEEVRRAKEAEAEARSAVSPLMRKMHSMEQKFEKLTVTNARLTEDWKKEQRMRRDLHNRIEDMKGKIRVFARARPLSSSEKERGCVASCSYENGVSILCGTGKDGKGKPKKFRFDRVFTPSTGQEEVFSDTKHLVRSSVDGYNVCIFAYGQTGSGKTYTMVGVADQDSWSQRPLPPHAGIAPRAVAELFRLISEYDAQFEVSVTVSMLELYRDSLSDLLASGRAGGKKGKKKSKKNKENSNGSNDGGKGQDGRDSNAANKLLIKKDDRGRVYVQGAVLAEVSTEQEMYEVFSRGQKNRATRSTAMNSESSRSHLVMTIGIRTTSRSDGAVNNGKLTLVDLAGSERVGKTGATGEMLKEAQSINKSLSALGDVISSLTSGKTHIPYRNHLLTMLMSDSIGHSAKALMFVNVSPADWNAPETANSLTFASRCKNVSNKQARGGGGGGGGGNANQQIQALRSELDRLRAAGQGGGSGSGDGGAAAGGGSKRPAVRGRGTKNPLPSPGALRLRTLTTSLAS